MQTIKNDSDLAYTNAIIEEKNKAIDELYNETKEMNILFVEVNKLIQYQGVEIDSISTNIQKVNHNIKDGIEQLHKAEVEQNKWCLLF